MKWKQIGKKCLYHSKKNIWVYQNWFYRWLQFDSVAIQSMVSHFRYSYPVLSYIKPLTLAARAHPSNCLMLGLGGGGVAHALTPHLGSASLEVVEAEAEIIEIANRFFNIRSIPRLTIIHQEASLFLSQAIGCFGHLIVDLFTSTNFPSECHSSDFFYNCHRLLLPQGVMAINLANSAEHWSIFKLIQLHFNRNTLTLPVPNSANLIILAQKSASIIPLIEELKTHKYLKKVTWDSKWGFLGAC